MTTYDVIITDDDDNRRVCTARLTCLIREQVPQRLSTSEPAASTCTYFPASGR